MSTICDARSQRGLTLVELVLFIVIMGVAAAAITSVLNRSSTASADPLRRKQAMMIAEAYMEEVQGAAFTYCDPADPAALTANNQNACATQETVRNNKTGLVRPYGNVADYALALGVENRSFATSGVDLDINGRPLGQDASLNTMGNASLAGITTTVTLNDLSASGASLGPGGLDITSTNANLNALRITITTRYGTGVNDVIQLDGYRTRYAPNFIP
ncbi:type IV pilus modification PilV family protein [Duganella sp. Dugasp56]|uniref:type IV pilus modification PilV family protein n=1 Tax=Duganella sp. Dugasp56 TaxID=3243046 RepID=UPI0039B108B0